MFSNWFNPERDTDCGHLFICAEQDADHFIITATACDTARDFAQNEIKPVLDAANETMSTIRGTALFLSDSVVQPAIKINTFFTTIRNGLEVLRKAFR